jgi:hypothetical protein
MSTPPVIIPTPGRVVWYRVGNGDVALPRFNTQGETRPDPFAALVVGVDQARNVNLIVFDVNGGVHARQNVVLLQGDDAPPDDGRAFAQWMPYQAGQAAKTEAALAGVQQTDRNHLMTALFIAAANTVAANPTTGAKVGNALREMVEAAFTVPGPKTPPPAEDSTSHTARMARAAHEVNRAYCEATGDNSQVPWDEAPAWQKESAILGVQAVLSGSTPEQLHQSRMAEKYAKGWTYGAVKDPANFEHPCLVPYDQLPPEQRVKDHIFRAAVRNAS